MAKRDWNKDWELTMRATPGPWKWVYYKWSGIYALEGPQDEIILDDGSYNGEYDAPGDRLISPNDPNGQFVAEAREALPYWLNQMLDVVMSLCHEGVMTMSRAREILGVTLHEADKLYAEWLKTYIEGK